MIDVSNIDPAALLAALYNNSMPLGMGSLDPRSAQQMTVEQAQSLLDNGQDYFDYLQGRVMKVEINGSTLDPWGYDRDNGSGAAKRVVEGLL